ncbi:PTS system, glucose subfamily, IIA subunit [Caldalkalibacillus thermarum TA2.A1]|uniref:PTS glucose transporter subunit IIA n=1 Tax=Caldalkalibacillus thermarum (strain TA2.A1) TaxID=986075 RepID=F5L5L7_CALTT|nr:PTS glucose transporter subunit IIA [Caldalkalibacillus thermarum]EGL83373.1 PTS system, glucose subfamily, IIA subunit [Caldalkalibacillus thermarum TA2.A1]QZT32867.1 PTS glucose transporter subunit IIA [Caldalkalibacillus thermarum TA2.A1]
MFKKWFAKMRKPSEETLVAPLSGQVVQLEEVPDPTFSQKMMGDGIAIQPVEGKVVSPVDGEIVQVFHTKHAVGIRSGAGAEILIHIGLETVQMQGEGFEAHVKQGDKVKAGDLLITFDLDLVKEKAASTVTPMVITNGDQIENLDKIHHNNVTAGQHELIKLKMKE